MNEIILKVRSAKKYPAMLLDEVFPPKFRSILSLIFSAIIIICLVFVISVKTIFPLMGIDFLSVVSKSTGLSFNFFLGTLLLAISFRLAILMWESFRKDLLFGQKTKHDLVKPPKNTADLLDYESLLVLNHARLHNLFLSLLKSPSFIESLLRVGITPQQYHDWFTDQEKEILDTKEIIKTGLEEAGNSGTNGITVKSMLYALNIESPLWQKFLFEHEIKPETILLAIEWAQTNRARALKKTFWWKKENLKRIPSLAKNWAYGITPALDSFSHNVLLESSSWAKKYHIVARQNITEKIEDALLRSAEANAVLTGEEGVGKKTILLSFAEMVRTKKIAPSLEGKRVLELDTASIISSSKTKAKAEEILIKIFNEAAGAGNIIIVLDNIADFVKSCASLDVDVLNLLSPYFKASNIKIIAISNIVDFREQLENNPLFGKYFEKIAIDEPDKQNLLYILKDVALALEKHYGIIATVQSLQSVIESTERYITEGALPERAVDLLESVFVSLADEKGKYFILPKDIFAVVKSKTKIPLGEIGDEEKELLSNLENKLHQRVIGQEQAIKSVSNALRRARAGIASAKKPIGTFLFLGPTGVGKTETAKTIAEVYFGNEDKMIRLDMSEYQNKADIKRFIGSDETKEPGLFASQMRQNPFSLVLLDEFEKAAPEILNLFLQILDEGFFTDAFGRKINMRNTIIVATSNAGANIIWDMVKKGSDPSELRQVVVDEIRKSGVFRPELLNRFDAMVVFHPLSKDDLEQIARLMLKKLALRLKQKDIELIMTNSLIDKLIEVGYSLEFGARPMQRAIQDKIEKYIADKIISGEIKRGSRVEFTDKELTNL